MYVCMYVYRDWMDAQPGLISSVVYTYLSLIPFHVSPSLANLKDQETQMCVSLIRTRVIWSLTMDTIGVLYNVVYKSVFSQAKIEGVGERYLLGGASSHIKAFGSTPIP